MPSVLITGGNGRTARHVIEHLLSHPNCPNLRVLVRPGGVDPLRQSHPLLTQKPHSIVVADYMEQGTLVPAFRDVSIVVHNGPSIHQNEAAMAIAVISAAKTAGVSHFLLCSVLHPMRTKLITHKLKLQIEEYLIESRLEYTILQASPTHYMQNVSLSHVLRSGKIPLGYSPSVEQGFVDLRDVCHIVRNILLEPGRHSRATYELVGENMPYRDVAKVLREVMHRDVECECIPLKKYTEMLWEGKVIQSEYAEDAIERIILYHNRWGLTGNANVARWLLGREPKTWKEYAADMFREA